MNSLYLKYIKLIISLILFVYPCALSQAAIVMSMKALPSFGVWQGGEAGRQFGINYGNNPIGSAKGDYLYGGASGKVKIKSDAGIVNATMTVTNVILTPGISLVEIRCRWLSVKYTPCTDGFVGEVGTSNKNLTFWIKIQTEKVHGAGDTESMSWDLEVIIQ